MRFSPNQFWHFLLKWIFQSVQLIIVYFLVLTDKAKEYWWILPFEIFWACRSCFTACSLATEIIISRLQWWCTPKMNHLLDVWEGNHRRSPQRRNFFLSKSEEHMCGTLRLNLRLLSGKFNKLNLCAISRAVIRGFALIKACIVSLSTSAGLPECGAALISMSFSYVCAN